MIQTYPPPPLATTWARKTGREHRSVAAPITAPPAPGLSEIVTRVVHCRRCALMVLDDGGDLSVDEATGLPAGATATASLADEAALARHVAATSEPLVVDNPAQLGDVAGVHGPYADRAFACVPVRMAEGVSGSLCATDRLDRTPFGDDDVAILQTLATFYASTCDPRAGRYLRHLRDEYRRQRATAVRNQEEERRRLAREIHDDTGHVLTTAILQLNLAARTIDDDGPLGETLAALGDSLTESAHRLQRLAFDLRPRLLEDLGLVPALRSLARRARESSGVAVEVRVSGEEWRLGDETELAAFRIAQEATTNALKHAAPSRITIAVSSMAAGVLLAVTDDGRGFAPAAPGTANGHGGHGLPGMAERAEIVGGTTEIESVAGRGTIVRAWLPAREDR